jgi:hypothetical protein
MSKWKEGVIDVNWGVKFVFLGVWCDKRNSAFRSG